MKASTPKAPKTKSVSKAKKSKALGDLSPVPASEETSAPAVAPVIMFYTMPGCPPCELVKGMLKKDAANAKHFDIVSLGTVKGEKKIDAAGIQAFPTFVRADGEKKVGAHKPADLVAWAAKSK